MRQEPIKNPPDYLKTQDHQSLRPKHKLRNYKDLIEQYAKPTRIIGLVDATGSMKPLWDKTVQSIQELIRRILETGKIELSWVAYRDYCDHHRIIEQSNWSDSVEYLKTFIERLIGKIPFHEFDQFSQEVKSQLKEWHTIPEKTVNQWKNSLNKYESQSTNYQNLCKQISQDFLRVESLSLTSEQAIVIEYLLKEVEELKKQLQVGSIETDEGLNQLEILADEIQGFVDEVSHRSRDAESSKTEDSSNKKLSLEEALMLLSLTLETLSLKSLKTSRNRYARIHHPDVGGDEKMMKKINQAYEILKEYLET